MAKLKDEAGKGWTAVTDDEVIRGTQRGRRLGVGADRPPYEVTDTRLPGHIVGRGDTFEEALADAVCHAARMGLP